MLQVFDPERHRGVDPVVITGIGIVTSLGDDRESSWSAIRRGECGVRRIDSLDDLPESLRIGAVVNSLPSRLPKQLKVVHLAHRAAEEAMADAALSASVEFDPSRFGCAVSGHMGDWRWLRQQHGFEAEDAPHDVSNWEQWLPNSSCWSVARRFWSGRPAHLPLDRMCQWFDRHHVCRACHS